MWGVWAKGILLIRENLGLVHADCARLRWGVSAFGPDLLTGSVTDSTSPLLPAVWNTFRLSVLISS